MRIISGTHKGRKLTAPKNLPVRPTTDFAKEALFNILRGRYYFDEIAVLDLFAGTGNISFEFASRGVPRITAVDGHWGCVQYINKVSQEFEFPIAAIKADVNKYLDHASGAYDIIFADPPYDFPPEVLKRLVEVIVDISLLNSEGILIIEHAKQNDLSSFPHFVEARKYGSSVFSFFN